MRTLAFAVSAILSFSAIASDARLEACRSKLIQAHALEVLTDMQWKGSTLHVVAGRTYYQIPFDAKEGFAETVNCFALAGKKGCLSFDIKHWMTGKATDRFHMCKLSPK
jgi:hypothetical protein